MVGFGPSHEGTVYRRSTTVGTDGQRTKTWTAATTGVGVNIQLLVGRVAAEAYGSETDQRADMFFEAGTDVRIGDGFLVTSDLESARTVPSRWEVRSVVPRGARFKIECEAELSAEDFGG